jgi:uncharacterized protein YjbJ (UPF0337 family)
MSKDEAKEDIKPVKGRVHKGLGKLTDDRIGQVKDETEIASDEAKQEIGGSTKKRKHQHYHSHDLSDHDHV